MVLCFVRSENMKPILLLDRTELPFEDTLHLDGKIFQQDIVRFADEQEKITLTDGWVYLISPEDGINEQTAPQYGSFLEQIVSAGQQGIKHHAVLKTDLFEDVGRAGWQGIDKVREYAENGDSLFPNFSEEAYFERWSRIKPLIESDEELQERIKAAFSAVYSRGSSYAPIIVPPQLQLLGVGKDHAVIGLNKVITDPETGKEIHLTLKMRQRGIHYSTEKYQGRKLEQQLGAYVSAFTRRMNPLYVVGVVTLNTPVYGGEKEEVAGILTEDVSERKTRELREFPGEESCERQKSDGSWEKIFIDPSDFAYSSGGEKYLAAEARIDL